LLPEHLDDYVTEDNPVRVVDVFVEELDLAALGFARVLPAKTGRPAYHPGLPPIDVILVCIRWYVAYPLSYRHLEEMMLERGVSVDHSSINRWAIRFLPLIEKMTWKHKRPVGGSWRMDETYIKVKGVWKYLYRAVDKQGKTLDFLLTAKRDMAAAKRFFDEAMGSNGDPTKVAMERSGANKAAIDAISAGRNVPILVRQVKYLNNTVEQDHRAIKRVTRPMLNFKSFRSAGSVLAGIELMHIIRKGQFAFIGADEMPFADQFYALAGQVRQV
jgi:putative transposase